LKDVRRKRDAYKVNELLTRLESAARGKDSLMPLFIECVEEYVTLGEICGILREVWGEYRPAAWL
jgi:methylmalonyl-CoA mutase N-terminal domain/subunit